ncbi:hypothetical protein [Hymenobacter ruricola]|uniref:HEPN AbiU2-like domain-containing protein n=1 Tax=Hymenobacter ruricola TaxID=2791023 RepID=A0ABS0HYH5_9BACT|nr:hypothetical protein [Hymenobacter ruricola]MBF9219679.1 hypothetical protein [Hymenobacter ruricola]
MPLLACLQEFRNKVAAINNMIAAAHRVDGGGSFFFSGSERAAIVESGLVRLFIAWEHFLERSFILYLIGTRSGSGIRVKRYAFPVDEAHANKIVIGGMRFMEWGTPDSVRKLSKLYFKDGEPYETVLTSISSELSDLKIVRNAASHLSSTTSASLDNLILRKLAQPIIGGTVAYYVLAVDPNSSSGETMLQVYENILDMAAELIARP